MAAPTLSRVKENLPNAPSTDDGVIQNLIDGVYALVKTYLGRDIDQQSYDHIFDGEGTNRLLLEQYPVNSISRIAIFPTQVLGIRNTDSSAARATVSVSSSAVTLLSVASGTTTTTSLTFASYPTLALLSAAIAATPNWTSTVLGNYANWSSADFRPIQGALNAKFQVGLKMHTYELSEYDIVDANYGILHYLPGFPRGSGNIRVVYNAGFASLPSDLEAALCELVANAYNSRGINSNLINQNLGGYSHTLAVDELFKTLSASAQLTFAMYKKRQLGHYYVR